MKYKNLIYRANSIRKYYRNISLEEAESLGLEQIILELTLRKKPLTNDEHYAIYLLEYHDRMPLYWKKEFYGKNVLQKNFNSNNTIQRKLKFNNCNKNKRSERI